MPPQPPKPPSVQSFKFGSFAEKKGQRIVIYGPGGIGKTSLACCAPGKSAMIDADESIPALRSRFAEMGTAVPENVGATDWDSMRKALQSPGWDGVQNIILDSITKIEEWAVAHTIENVRHEKGQKVKSVEDYGYGKGFQFVFDTFLPLLGDLDRHARAGRNVILIAHDCISNVPNPEGDDWIRYEPRLQSPSSGKASIRLRVREWCDQMLFIGYDVVAKDKKGSGSGTRSLYASELPHCMAKSRTWSGKLDLEDGVNPWPQIIK